MRRVRTTGAMRTDTRITTHDGWPGRTKAGQIGSNRVTQAHPARAGPAVNPYRGRFARPQGRARRVPRDRARKLA